MSQPTPIEKYLTNSEHFREFKRNHIVGGIVLTVASVGLGVLSYHMLSAGQLSFAPHMGMSGNITASAMAGYTVLSLGALVLATSYLARVHKKRERKDNEHFLAALAAPSTRRIKDMHYIKARLKRRIDRLSKNEMRALLTAAEGKNYIPQDVLSPLSGHATYEEIQNENLTPSPVRLADEVQLYQKEVNLKGMHILAFGTCVGIVGVALGILAAQGGVFPGAGLQLNAAVMSSGGFVLLSASGIATLLNYMRIEKKYRFNLEKFVRGLAQRGSFDELRGLSALSRAHPLAGENYTRTLDYAVQRLFEDQTVETHPAAQHQAIGVLMAANPEKFAAYCRAQLENRPHLARFLQEEWLTYLQNHNFSAGQIQSILEVIGAIDDSYLREMAGRQDISHVTLKCVIGALLTHEDYSTVVADLFAQYPDTEMKGRVVHALIALDARAFLENYDDTLHIFCQKEMFEYLDHHHDEIQNMHGLVNVLMRANPLRRGEFYQILFGADHTVRQVLKDLNDINPIEEVVAHVPTFTNMKMRECVLLNYLETEAGYRAILLDVARRAKGNEWGEQLINLMLYDQQRFIAAVQDLDDPDLNTYLRSEIFTYLNTFYESIPKGEQVVKCLLELNTYTPHEIRALTGGQGSDAIVLLERRTGIDLPELTNDELCAVITRSYIAKNDTRYFDALSEQAMTSDDPGVYIELMIRDNAAQFVSACKRPGKDELNAYLRKEMFEFVDRFYDDIEEVDLIITTLLTLSEMRIEDLASALFTHGTRSDNPLIDALATSTNVGNTQHPHLTNPQCIQHLFDRLMQQPEGYSHVFTLITGTDFDRRDVWSLVTINPNAFIQCCKQLHRESGLRLYLSRQAWRDLAIDFQDNWEESKPLIDTILKIDTATFRQQDWTAVPGEFRTYIEATLGIENRGDEEAGAIGYDPDAVNDDG